ncbi:hypothetical protein ADICYQ_1620 [Cyclobacterium qasimii M12-11B]|uniref:Uncharacterized protein n=1 Tax=Cyclobacterium qasimii M12-11B TaxID=641524 RepID=S7VGM9_9BACT|nr:hypothetical protein ADICYQ_1620 [Cyclobacterium qasimii M12-11B]
MVRIKNRIDFWLITKRTNKGGQPLIHLDDLMFKALDNLTIIIRKLKLNLKTEAKIPII